MKDKKFTTVLISFLLTLSTASFASSKYDKLIAGTWIVNKNMAYEYGKELEFRTNYLVWSKRTRSYFAHWNVLKKWEVLKGKQTGVEIYITGKSWHGKRLKYILQQNSAGQNFMLWPGVQSPYLTKISKTAVSNNFKPEKSNSKNNAAGNIKRTGPFAGFTGYWIPLHKNGKNARKVPFYKGQKHGTGFWYYESGRIHYQTGWQHGKAHGIETEYWDKPGRKKKCKISYKNGMKNGWENRYNNQGLPIKSILWKDNKKVEERKY